MREQTYNSAHLDVGAEIRAFLKLLGHEDYGVTELRAFEPRAMVAITDNERDAVGLCLEMDGKARGLYMGAQCRPAHLIDRAPNRWVPARGGPEGNCARDGDIEYIGALGWDVDAVSPQRQQGHPASDEELERTFLAAQLLQRHEGLAICSAIVCTANGHQVWASIIPISVDGPQVALQFKLLCERIAADVAGKVDGVRIDPIYNLSRVARVPGTWNLKGQPLPDRPHRRAHFVTEPPCGRSLALHYMILGTDIQEVVRTTKPMPQGLKCDLAGIERCEFVRWCRQHAREVSEPQWFGLISNLAHLEGGTQRVHEISRLDALRYDYADTERVIERVVREGYKPVNCASLVSPAMARPGRGVFHCSCIGRCPARAPMYLAVSHTVYTR